MVLGRTHWQTIEQGFQSAATILQAFHDFASLDTATTREELMRLWEAAKAEKQGDYAYDTSTKVGRGYMAPRGNDANL